ncbi:MAG: T9SS type A sorting domain-containing protein [Aureispira sp.]|nr:T9SS type A sorting domain-containing protein [Aureispira sp.]
MKLYIQLCLFGFFMSTNSFSVQAQYHKLLNNTHFFYTIQNQMGMSFSGSVVVGADTTINSMSYTKLIDTLQNVTSFVREDSAQQKSWTFIHNYPTEVILYDFSLSVGSLITLQRTDFYTATFQVNIVDSVNTLLGFRKRIILSNVTFFPDQLIWIEGVGALSHPIYLPLINSDPFYRLTCVHQDSVQVYDSGLGTCPLWSTITHVENVNRFGKDSPIRIYPNPVINEVNIELGDLRARTINVYTITGVLIDTKNNINASIYNLSLQGKTKGVYILEIITENKKYQQLFIKE